MSKKQKIVMFSKKALIAMAACLVLLVLIVLSSGENEMVFAGLLGSIFLLIFFIVLFGVVALMIVEGILELIAECKEKGVVAAISRFLLEVALMCVVLWIVNQLMKTDGNLVQYVVISVAARIMDRVQAWWRRE